MAENDGHRHEWYWSPETGQLRCKMCRASCDPIDRIAALEAEREQQRELKEAAMRRMKSALAVVRAVAALDDTQIDYQCMHCLSPQLDESDLGPFLHSGDCPIAQARALVAGQAGKE